METIENLTPAELELIKIKREEKRLADEKKAAVRKADQEKKIFLMKNSILDFQKKNEEKNLFIQESFETLNQKHPGKYQLKNIESVKHFECSDYYTDTEREEKGITEKYSTFKLAEENLQYNYLIIERVDNPKIFIKADYKDVTLRYVHQQFELRLFIEGLGYEISKKSFKNVLTIHKNIQDEIDLTQSKDLEEKRSEEGWGILLQELQKEFQNDNATFEKKKEFICYKHMTGGFFSKKVYVTFLNGLKLSYSFRYYQDTKTGQMVFIKDLSSEIDTSKLDQTKMINALKTL